MNNASNHDRVRNLYQMLFEMATGNLTFRIRESAHNDELDQLARLINKIAEQMHAAILKSGHVNPHFTYQNLLQLTIVLEKHLIINSFTADVPKILGYAENKLFGMNFSDLIAEQSRTLWEAKKLQAAEDNNFHETLQLVLIAENRHLIPTFCTASRLIYSDKIVISSVTTILADQVTVANNPASEVHPKQADEVLIQSLYDYIVNNLEEPLPSAKELSKMFGTNEFRLKDGFRHFFKTSIYHFYNEERLKKAHLEIQQTNTPIKTIAFACGFNDYTNFYKAFKKRFKYAPTELQRPSSEF
jgi:AraC-like DNA-binding protein